MYNMQLEKLRYSWVKFSLCNHNLINMALNRNSSYHHALISPFDKVGEGAQIPDMYSFPTSTQTFTTTTSVFCDGAGNFDFAIIPSMLNTAYTSNSLTFNGLSNVTDLSNVTQYNGTTFTTPQTPAIYGILNIDQVGEIFRQYRKVEFGVRFRSQLTPLNAKGTLRMCVLPSINQQPDDAWLSNATDLYQVVQRFQLPALSVNTVPGTTDTLYYFDPILQSYPTGHQMDAFEFNSNGLEWVAKPTGPTAFEWINGQQGACFAGPNPANTFDGTGVFDGVTTVVNNSSGQLSGNVVSVLSANAPNTWNAGSWSQLVVRGVGFPVSEVAGEPGNGVQVGVLEFKVHVEYIPATTAIYSQGKFPMVKQNYLNECIDQLAGMPLYRSIETDVNEQLVSRGGFIRK